MPLFWFAPFSCLGLRPSSDARTTLAADLRNAAPTTVAASAYSQTGSMSLRGGGAWPGMGQALAWG